MIDKVKPVNLRELVDFLNGNKSEAARRIGVTSSAVGRWLKDDEAPRMAELAASHLCEELFNSSVPCVFLVQIEQKHREEVEEWIELCGGKIVPILS